LLTQQRHRHSITGGTTSAAGAAAICSSSSSSSDTQDSSSSYLAFRNATQQQQQQQQQGATTVTQVRALLPDDVASEIKASLDLRPRSHLFTQRGGHPYIVAASFEKRLRAAIKVALAAGGQSSVSYQDLLAVARSTDAAVEQAVKSIAVCASALGSS
jgi:hypothetical protein